MNLRPTYVFDTMQSKGINGINPGRMILVGESLANNTGIFIVDKDTTALTANTTIQQALDGGYLKMLKKKTTEKFGEYQFDNISNSNPVVSSELTLGKTWLNQTTGEIFITATVNGIMGWKGNKGTSVFKKPVPILQGYLNTTAGPEYPSSAKKDFQILYFQIWDITNNRQISSTYSKVCLEKNSKYVKDYMWILTNFPTPFPKWGDVEEQALAAANKINGKTLAALVTSVSNVTSQGVGANNVCSAVDYLVNFKYYGSGASEEEYLALEPEQQKTTFDASNIPQTLSRQRVSLVFNTSAGMKNVVDGIVLQSNNFDVIRTSIPYYLGGCSPVFEHTLTNGNHYTAISKTMYDSLKNNLGKVWYYFNSVSNGTITKNDYLSNAWVW